MSLKLFNGKRLEIVGGEACRKVELHVQFFGVTCDYLPGVSERNIADNKDIISELENIERSIADIKKYLNKQ